MAKKIVVIEDEKDLLEIMELKLAAEGFDVVGFTSGEEALGQLSRLAPSAILLDWNLPGIQGIDILRQVRDQFRLIPIFMVTAYVGERDILEGLNAGADDYITKPFSYGELIARLKNAIYRSELSSPPSDVRFIDSGRVVQFSGNDVALTEREYGIFKMLYEGLDDVVTRDVILEQLFHNEREKSRIIDVHVVSLRKKLTHYGFIIRTVRGQGYKLVHDTRA